MADPEPQSSEADDDRKAATARELHDTVREEGQDELDRPAASLFWSGLAAGLAINASLLAEGAIGMHLPADVGPWRELVVAMGYPVGFLIVILGRMQLFTESTVTAMLPLVTRPSRWALARTLRLWGIVLGANLTGTAIAAALCAAGVLGNPDLRAEMIAISMGITELGAAQTLVNAIPAGFLIAIVAWALPNAREQSFWVIVTVTYIVAIAGFSHSVVGSDEAWLLLFTGHVGVAQTVFGLLVPAIVGNLIGGAGVFAVLAHAQVRSEVDDR